MHACIAKQFGGLGILGLHLMNISLLLKCLWKLKYCLYTSMWKTLILYKYYSTSMTAFSHFWNEIVKLESLRHINTTYEPGI